MGRGSSGFIEIVRVLRSPEGCPWDREQTVESLRPFVLLEEKPTSILQAIDTHDRAALQEELGDFLFEAIFVSRICEEEGSFVIGDAIQSITDKLIRRHPHVFTPDGVALGNTSITSREVKERWGRGDQGARRAAQRRARTLLAVFRRTMPALLRAYELATRGPRSASTGSRRALCIDKIDEEVTELREAVANAGAQSDHAEEELGDLFFALANLSRKLGIEPETALRRANDSFQARFDQVERRVRDEGRELGKVTLEDLEAHWRAVKRTASEV